MLCTGSFSGAARVEQVSVRAVSKGLGELEAELGQTLFIRGSKGAAPTPFCQGIKPLIQGALDRVARIEGFAKSCDVAAFESRPGLKVLIAVPHFNNWQGVCTGLEQFLGRQLGMKVSLGISVGNAALSQLYDDNIDAFITVGSYENPACDSVTVGALPAGVFCPKSHPLYGKGSVTIADLAPYPTGYVIGLDDFNETIVNIYRKHGMKSAIVPVATGEEYERLLSERTDSRWVWALKRSLHPRNGECSASRRLTPWRSRSARSRSKIIRPSAIVRSNASCSRNSRISWELSGPREIGPTCIRSKRLRRERPSLSARGPQPEAWQSPVRLIPMRGLVEYQRFSRQNRNISAK